MIVDLCALFVSVLAFTYAAIEIRRNNSVVLKIRECRCTYSHCAENGGQPFSEFQIVIQNCGISLHHPQVAFSFRDGDGFGNSTFPLEHRPMFGDGSTEFAKGMIAEFSVKSYELDENRRQFLMMLSDCRRQDAAICVYSQGYFAKEFGAGGFTDRMKHAWNEFAYKINSWFERTIELPGGRKGLKTFIFLPRFTVIGFPVSRFIENIRREHDKSTAA